MAPAAASQLLHELSTTGTFRTLLVGVGLAYAVETKPTWHIPLPILFPGIYVGYQSYQNRDTLCAWTHYKRKTLEKIDPLQV